MTRLYGPRPGTDTERVRYTGVGPWVEGLGDGRDDVLPGYRVESLTSLHKEGRSKRTE